MALRLPWVSIRAYEAVSSERDRLRAQNDVLLAHVTRIDRVEHGMSEAPRVAKLTLQPMPKELREHIDGFATPAIQKTMRDQAYRRHAAGTAWDEIMRDMMREEEQT